MENDEYIEKINALSDDAYYVVGRDWFGQVIMGKPILAVALNERQEKLFAELLNAGFVYFDVEQGKGGYRSTFTGQQASAIVRSVADAQDLD